nr:hypothetical protein [Tanacetum cinerariifolium]
FLPFTRQLAQLAEVIVELEKAGLNLHAHRHPDEARGAGILFLDAASSLPLIEETLADVRRTPGTSVLAVSLGRLPGPSTWALLRSGVADVFSWVDVENPVATVTDRLRYWQDLDTKVADLQGRLVGSSSRWRDTLRQ